MMHKLVSIAAAALLALSVWGAGAVAQGRPEAGVFVRGPMGEGNGLTHFRGKECFVVVPYHVMGDRMSTDPFTTPSARVTPADVQATPRQPGRAVYETGEPSGDWAILQVRTPSDSVCARWPSPRAASRALAALSRPSDAVVMHRDESGAVEQIPVVVRWTSGERLRLRSATRQPLSQGVSGSLVRLGGVVVGMVVSVSGDTAQALPLAYLDQRTRRFFGAPIPPAGAAVVASLAVPGIGHLSAHRRRAGVAWLGLTTLATAAAVAFPRDVRKQGGAFDYVGVWQPYTYVQREYPLRRFVVPFWVASGALSGIEALLYTTHPHLPPTATAPRSSRPDER
jgi:hypothetical protein